MNLKVSVFRQLYARRDEYLSGEEIAKAEHVSRAAIWKAVRALRADGCEILSLPNRGYRLISTGDALDRETLCALFSFPVYHLKRVSSTNSFAKSLDGATPLLVVADAQTDGRARYRRPFDSPEGAGLYMSYLFTPDDDFSVAEATSFSAQTVAEIVGGRAEGQEVFIGGKKQAGVLVESVFDIDGAQSAIVGIGIYTEGLKTSRLDLLIKIVSALHERYKNRTDEKKSLPAK